jgi:23S rRNA (guanine2445-N2)-methyltransferase / 23S rRNA (guanine2069-N7)-methyltransferase
MHRRGYRDAITMAPLKENLAASLLIAMDWPQRAKEGESFCDPLCGSGTFLIEAAMIAADIAPQLNREYFGFLAWKGHNSSAWDKLLSDAKQRAETGLASMKCSISGSDKSTQVVRVAEQNIARAGLQDVIDIRIGNIKQIQYPSSMPSGLLVCNPPYGVRLESSGAGPASLYADLGKVFKSQFGGWRVAVITGNTDLMYRLRLKTTSVLKCTNGGIDCRLYQADVPKGLVGGFSPEEMSDESDDNSANTKSPWATSSVLKLPPVKQAHSVMFANRLAKNFKQLKKWAKTEGAGAYRVYDADLPEYALAIDVYESDQRYVHVQEYRAPATIDKAIAAERLKAAIAEIPDVLGCDPDAISLKVRRRQSGSDQYEKLQSRKEMHIISEHVCKFEVNLFDYLDTGIFADHRKIRQWIFKQAKDLRFLNLFAYTGTATVHAALGGAKSTTTVDMSSNYLAWAERNLALNLSNKGEHEFIRADCLDWLENPPEGAQFDLILLDPPTFSNSNKMEQDWDVQRDHVKLIRQALKLLSPDGLLIFSNNFRKFKLDEKNLDRYEITDKSRASIPRDYSRNAKIHQCYFIKHRQ